MTRYYKIVPCLFAAVILLVASCKKNTSAPITDNTAAISKQLALNLYQSLSSGISTTTSGGLKPNSLRIQSASVPTCGDVVSTVTNKTEAHGDTTRTYLGNSIFTYMCNGVFNNGKDLDAYTLKDTLTTTNTGSSFKSSYKTVLNYIVKAIDPNYRTLSVDGTTSTVNSVSTIRNGATTESHTITTDYSWDRVIADRSGPKTMFIFGIVNFNAVILDKDANTGPSGKTYTYSGSMWFLADNTIRLTVKIGDVTKTYTVNVLTGETIAV